MVDVKKTMFERVLDFAALHVNSSPVNNKQGYVLIPESYVKSAMQDVVKPTIGERLGYSAIMTIPTTLALVSSAFGASCDTVATDEDTSGNGEDSCDVIGETVLMDSSCLVFDDFFAGSAVVTEVTSDGSDCVVKCQVKTYPSTLAPDPEECRAVLTFDMNKNDNLEKLELADVLIYGGSVCSQILK